MDTSTSTYFDFKNNIESHQHATEEKIMFLEIYIKRALEELDKLDAQYKSLFTDFDVYKQETNDFNCWYRKQSIFKKLWWNIRKYSFEHLKQLQKEKDGNIQH